MKPLWIACFLLSSLCVMAQTSNGAVSDSAQDKVKDLRLEDVPIHVESDGTFKTVTGTTKQISTLKVSDLPSSDDPPFSIESTFKCATFEALVAENEKRGGALARLVPPEVLAAIPAAATSCLVRNMISVPDNVRDFVIADIAAIVDAQAELDRREYDNLVERYNELAEKHNRLLSITRSLASQLAVAQSDLSNQQRINSFLAIYELMPKYTPPQRIRIQVTDCTQLPALCVH